MQQILLILFTVFICIAVIFCFVMAIVSGVTRAKFKHGRKKLNKKNKSVSQTLNDDGFKISKQFEAETIVVETKKFQAGANVTLKPFIGFFVDEESKKIAIGSYQNGSVKYFGYNEISKYELIEEVGESNSKPYVKKLSIVLRTSNESDPFYVISIVKKRTFTISPVYKSAADFQKNVTSFLDSIITK